MEPISEVVARELGLLPAQYLAQLPAAHVFVAWHAELDLELVFVTSQLVEPRNQWPELTFDGPELQALIAGLCCERLQEEEFRNLCARKLAEPQMRVTLQDTVGDAQPVASQQLTTLDVFYFLQAIPISHGTLDEGTEAYNPVHLPQAA